MYLQAMLKIKPQTWNLFNNMNKPQKCDKYHDNMNISLLYHVMLFEQFIYQTISLTTI